MGKVLCLLTVEPAACFAIRHSLPPFSGAKAVLEEDRQLYDFGTLDVLRLLLLLRTITGLALGTIHSESRPVYPMPWRGTLFIGLGSH